MLVGEIGTFAIEAVGPEKPEDWVLGHFRFWLDGNAVGDWNDTVDLKGCIQWLLDFVANPRNRYEPGLESKSAQEIFELAYDPVIAEGDTVPREDPPIPDAFSRFHISHLGTSSFDAFDILLVKNAFGRERVLWRKAGESKIEECYLEAGAMESVVLSFCSAFQKEIEG
jgi:hypothetical protein